ncbi:MAG: HEAT repeat domain-containing protein [Actinoplanes sp.]
MSLLSRLRDPDDVVRLQAAHQASGGRDEPGLVETLLDVALHDRAEVRTGGGLDGLDEEFEYVGDAAVEALRTLLPRQAGPDRRVRSAAYDLGQDDDQVARLLYLLGPDYEPLRGELADNGEGRLRLRSLKAVLAMNRTVELTTRFLTDPAPAVRVEAILGAPADVSVETIQEFLGDPAPEVRRAAAQSLSHSPADCEVFVKAARTETDLMVQRMLLSALKFRRRDPRAVPAIVTFLDHDAVVQTAAASSLYDADDPGVAAAIASRVLVQDDPACLSSLLGYPFLLTHEPEMRPMLERMQRQTPSVGFGDSLTMALAVPAGPAVSNDPSHGLTPQQWVRLHHEVIGWAVAALAQSAAPGELDALRAWLAAPEQPISDPGYPGISGEVLRAAASGDLRQAMEAGMRAAVAGMRRENADRPDVAHDAAATWAAELTRLAHLFTARQLKAGFEPLAPARLRHLLPERESADL